MALNKSCIPEIRSIMVIFSFCRNDFQEWLGSPDQLEHTIFKRIRMKLYIYIESQTKDRPAKNMDFIWQRKALKKAVCIKTSFNNSSVLL